LFPALALVEALGPPRTDATWQAQGKALLIDDDRMVLVVGRRLLKRLGFEVVTAGTAEAALRAVRGADEDFAVILMDWRMPGTDPLATLTTLRQEAPSTPVVLCSGYNESYLNARLGSVRPAGIIQKPFRADELREAVRDAVERPGSR
jgi:CheY-like chemotaxis protein